MTTTQSLVIGAGISGLAAAKTFLAKGYSVVVVERGRCLGGVWSPERTYPGLTTQTPRDQYAFSDYPMPARYDSFPSAAQMFEYLTGYARSHGVAPLIRYQTTVTGLVQEAAQGRWTVTTSSYGAERTDGYDLVAVCAGIFHRPNLPNVPGTTEFQQAGGVVRHSGEVTDPDLFAGRHVIVVGFGKSASDLACVAAGRAASTALVYRRAMWKLPHFIGGVIPVTQMMSRFSELMFEPPDPSPRERAFHRYGTPFVNGFWHGVQALLRAQLRLRAVGCVPVHPLRSQMSCLLSLDQHDFYRNLRQGRIAGHQSAIAELEPGAARLANGTRLPADVVVFATGWDTGLPDQWSSVRECVLDPDGYYRLYRNIVSPDLSGIGFVGYNSSIACQLTAEVSARWLAEWFDGQIDCPAPERMHEEVAARLEWFKINRPMQTRSFRNTCITPFDHRYLDELLRDMNAPTRISRNPLSAVIRPLDPSDYAELLAAVPSRAPVRGK